MSQSFIDYLRENTGKTQVFKDKASKMAQHTNKVVVIVYPYWSEPYIVAVPTGSVRQFQKKSGVTEFVESNGELLAYADWYTPQEIEDLSIGV